MVLSCLSFHSAYFILQLLFCLANSLGGLHYEAESTLRFYAYARACVQCSCLKLCDKHVMYAPEFFFLHQLVGPQGGNTGLSQSEKVLKRPNNNNKLLNNNNRGRALVLVSSEKCATLV